MLVAGTLIRSYILYCGVKWVLPAPILDSQMVVTQMNCTSGTPHTHLVLKTIVSYSTAVSWTVKYS